MAEQPRGAGRSSRAGTDGQLPLRNGGVHIHHDLGGLLRQRHRRLAGPHLDIPLQSGQKLTEFISSSYSRPGFGGSVTTIGSVCLGQFV